MRRIVFILTSLMIVIAITSSCTKPQKAKRLIRQEFKETLNDYKSYKPVSYSYLEPIFEKEKEEEPKLPLEQRIQYAQENYDNWVKIVEEYKEKYGEESSFYKDGLENVKAMKKALDEVIQSTQVNNEDAEKGKTKEIVGWSLNHKYRARVPAGGYRLFSTHFVFDKEITKIVSSYDYGD